MCLITLGGPSNLPYIYSKLLTRDNLPHFSGFIIQINEQQTMPYKTIPLHHSKTHTNSNCNFCSKVGFEKLLLRIIPKSIALFCCFVTHFYRVIGKPHVIDKPNTQNQILYLLLTSKIAHTDGKMFLQNPYYWFISEHFWACSTRRNNN